MRYYKKALIRELEASRGERRITAFLKRNPRLLVSAFSNAYHILLVCPEFRFGNQFRADFAVLSCNSCEWIAHLVELEPVGDTFFLSNGTDSKALRYAKKQIADWNFYIKNHLNEFRDELITSAIKRNVFQPKTTSRLPHEKWGWKRQYIQINYHIVIGRRATLSSEDEERRSFYYDTNSCQLITYDRFVDLADAIDAEQKRIEKLRPRSR